MSGSPIAIPDEPVLLAVPDEGRSTLASIAEDGVAARGSAYGRMMHRLLYPDCPGNVSPDVAAGAPFDGYPGGKGSAGTAQKIIRLFPPHSMYVELCLGNGSVLRAKNPALRSIGVEKDPAVVGAWKRAAYPGLEVLQACAIYWLETIGPTLPRDALVYADPPYPLSTRKHRRIYRCEMTDADHARLLNALDALKCSVFVSTYDNPMYRARLGLWNRETFDAGTRGGKRTECVYWRAGDTDTFGVDVRFVGRNFRERERIKRKTARWVNNLKGMRQDERSAVLQALIDAYGEGIRK